LSISQVVAAAWTPHIEHQSIERGKMIGQEALPREYGSWTQTSYEPAHQRPGSQYGEYSRTFVYEHAKAGLAMTFSFDFPFSNAWHELCICYQSAGWQLMDRTVRSVASQDGTAAWNFIAARFEKPSGEHGYLCYAYFDGTGQPISPPAGTFWERAMQRVRRRTPHLQTPRYFQIQAWTVAAEPLPDGHCEAVEDAFFEFRKRIRQAFLEPQEPQRSQR
jgi:hypothetical protein